MSTRDTLTDDELLRYSRQIMLPNVDVAGQLALRSATVAIIGVGGLGCPAALYLAAAGVGTLILADDDRVDLTNLQRQILHTTARVGALKVDSARDALSEINPDVQIRPIATRMQGDELRTLVQDADVVVDATDNFDSRFELNRTCVVYRTPLVSGAAIRWEGQIAVFDARRPDSPCYQCLYAEGDDTALNCSENGIAGPVVGLIGVFQALETIKLITGAGDPCVGHVMYFDGLAAEWRKFRLPKLPDCPGCGTGAAQSDRQDVDA